MAKTSTLAAQPNIGLHVEPDAQGGYVVRKVDRFGSGDKAGIKQGDRILAFNQVTGPTQAAFAQLAEQVGVGNSLVVKLVRADQPLELAMKLVAKKIPVSLEISAIEEVLERKISP
jgi:S1-C subfamily serine protease